MIKCLGQEAVRHNPAEPLLIGDALRCTSTLINAKENQAAPHRSAWDRRIMHGPLMATLPMDLLRCYRPDARVQHVEFKVVRPTFDRQAFSIHGQPSSGGKTVHLWGRDQERSLTMDATATLA